MSKDYNQMYTLKYKFIQSFLITLITLVLAKITYAIFALGTFIDLAYLPVISLFVSAVIVTKQLIHETNIELKLK